MLDRAIAGRVPVSVSVPVLSDAIHKVMMSEAAQLAGRDRAGIVGYLNKHPEIIARLVEYPQAMERLGIVPMNILPVDAPLLSDAARIAVGHRLLTNDAMIVALMQRHGLTHYSWAGPGGRYLVAIGLVVGGAIGALRSLAHFVTGEMP